MSNLDALLQRASMPPEAALMITKNELAHAPGTAE